MTNSPLPRARATRSEVKSGPAAERRVFAVVVEAVQNEGLKPGDRVVERALAESARANRQAIRNGLLELANAGLVEISRNKGARIAKLAPDEAMQVFETRIVIETALLKKLAQRFGEEDAAALQDIVRAEGEAYDDGRIQEARHQSRAFHMEFCRRAGNKFLSRVVVDLINCQPLLLSNRLGKRSEFSGHSLHIKTLAALARGDGAEAAHYNTELLSALQREMLRDIQAKKHAEAPLMP